MKFLLVVSVNHQELKAKITYYMGEIGAQFQIMECFAQLYPSETMVSNVSGAYTEFLVLLRKSIEWCKEAVLGKDFSYQQVWFNLILDSQVLQSCFQLLRNTNQANDR